MAERVVLANQAHLAYPCQFTSRVNKLTQPRQLTNRELFSSTLKSQMKRQPHSVPQKRTTSPYVLRHCAPKPCQQSVSIHQVEQGLNLIASVYLSFLFTGSISKHSYTLRQSWVRPSTYKFGRASSVCNTVCSRCTYIQSDKKSYSCM